MKHLRGFKEDKSYLDDLVFAVKNILLDLTDDGITISYNVQYNYNRIYLNINSDKNLHGTVLSPYLITICDYIGYNNIENFIIYRKPFNIFGKYDYDEFIYRRDIYSNEYFVEISLPLK